MLHEIKTGWRRLDQPLNEVIRAINRQQPLPSASIAVEESPNGTLLKVISTGRDQQPSSAGGGGDGGGGGPIVWHNVGWTTVTVVDPATCAQSSLTVLAQKTGSSITIS